MHPPTPSQWTAVAETAQHLLVAAGAGTGKTHTVVWKVLYLPGAEVHGQRIAEPLSLRDIAAITYTNQAAKDLKEALRRGLRAVGRRDDAFEVDLARIGTIHSFCSDLLREHALRAGRPPFREVLEEGVGRELALEAARDTLVEGLDRPGRAIDGLDTLLAAHKSTEVDRWVTDLMRRADLVRRLHADSAVAGWERVRLELATRARPLRGRARLRPHGHLDARPAARRPGHPRRAAPPHPRAHRRRVPGRRSRAEGDRVPARRPGLRRHRHDAARAGRRVAMGPGRHSATSLLAHSRCGKRHWLKYVAGLREPESFGSRETLISAVARGQIAHDVIERYDEESAELDVLLEDAIGRWDEHAPPPDTATGRRYRGELRGEVERVVEHPEWSERVARAGTRRELSFLHLAGPDAVTQGAIDLAAIADDGEALELIDVKTTRCSAPEAARRAEVYRPQQEVYVVAASAISRLPVLRFGFLYSRPGVNVESELDDAGRADASRSVLERIGRAASGEAEMTTDAGECRACGFRRVRLCAGVE